MGPLITFSNIVFLSIPAANEFNEGREISVITHGRCILEINDGYTEAPVAPEWPIVLRSNGSIWRAINECQATLIQQSKQRSVTKPNAVKENHERD